MDDPERPGSEHLPVTPEPRDTPYGVMEADELLHRRGSMSSCSETLCCCESRRSQSQRSTFGSAVPFAGNPEGVGYHLEARAAANASLPRIEDPRQIIRSWNDRPVPVGFGFCRRDNGQRLARGLEVEPQSGAFKQVKRELMNRAFPAMIAPSLSPGEGPVGPPIRVSIPSSVSGASTGRHGLSA